MSNAEATIPKPRRRQVRRCVRAAVRLGAPLLFVAIGAVWLLSLRWDLRFGVYTPARVPRGVVWTQYHFDVADDFVEFTRYKGQVTERDEPVYVRVGWQAWRKAARPKIPRNLPFAIPVGPSPWMLRWSRPGEPLMVAVPLWMPLAGAGLPTLLVCVSCVRWLRRYRAGQCPACGYDLMGLKEGACCPECGKPVVEAAAG